MYRCILMKTMTSKARKSIFTKKSMSSLTNRSVLSALTSGSQTVDYLFNNIWSYWPVLRAVAASTNELYYNATLYAPYSTLPFHHNVRELWVWLYVRMCVRLTRHATLAYTGDTIRRLQFFRPPLRAPPHSAMTHITSCICCSGLARRPKHHRQQDAARRKMSQRTAIKYLPILLCVYMCLRCEIITQLHLTAS